jgi:AraC-like DNA-binding protein
MAPQLEAATSLKIWSAPELQGATLLRGDLSSHTFPRHTHDEFVVGINVRGAHTFRCRAATHEVPPGTIALVNAGEVHTGAALGDAGWEYRAFYLHQDLLDTVAADAERSRPGGVAFERCVVRDAGLARLLAVAHDALASDETEALERETLAATAVAKLVRQHAAKVSSPPAAVPQRALAKVRDFIRSEYRRTIRLRELQELSGYDKYRLISSFRTTYGQPPYELVVALRVAEARARLARRQSIASVATSVGFSDQSHLTRQFKRIVGVTPGQYARAFAADLIRS